jgi:large subunit ribosomal protein L4
MPKKEKRAALAAALSSKVSDSRMVLLDKLELAGPRTKQMSELLKALGVAESALVLIAGENKNVSLASRNMPNVKVIRMENINVYDLLKYRYLITTQDALKTMQEVYGK